MKIRMVFSFGLIMLLMTACNVVRGSGDVISETRSVSGFDKVSLSGQGEIILTQGETESLEIEAEDNIVAVIETEVRGNTLHIGPRNNTQIRPTEPVRFYLSAEEITGLEVSGSGAITVDALETDSLSIEVSGSGDINIGNLSTDDLALDISGSGDVEIEGQASSQVIRISGSGKYEAADLESAEADVEVNGSGEANLWVTETLTIDISGSGTVNYYGSPIVSQDVSGSGEINGLGDR